MRQFIYKIFSNLFIISGLFLLALSIIEDVHPGFVSLWFDLRIFLVIIFVSGLIALLLSKNFDKITS